MKLINLVASTIDLFILTQSANIVISFAAPIISIYFLNDADIVSSQTILSITQLSSLILSVYLSASSLETFTKQKIYSVMAYSTACSIIFSLCALLISHLRGHLIISSILFASTIAGEASAISRSKIINESNKRFSLVVINLIASIVRMLSFLIFLRLWEPLTSFILSAAFSNLGRVAGVCFVSARLPKFTMVMQDSQAPSRNIDWLTRIGAFFDRNPSSLIVLVLSAGSPMFGLPVQTYALSLPLMNISASIASIAWTKYENLANRSDVNIIVRFGIIALCAAALAVLTSFIVPSDFVRSESFSNLKNSPLELLAAPVIFGFSTGLNVLTYGQRTSSAKALLVAILFWIFGGYGFIMGLFVNISFLLASIPENRHKSLVGVK